MANSNKAPVPGTITKVGAAFMTVKGDNGEWYHPTYFQLHRNTPRAEGARVVMRWSEGASYGVWVACPEDA